MVLTVVQTRHNRWEGKQSQKVFLGKHTVSSSTRNKKLQGSDLEVGSGEILYLPFHGKSVAPVDTSRSFSP